MDRTSHGVILYTKITSPWIGITGCEFKTKHPVIKPEADVSAGSFITKAKKTNRNRKPGRRQTKKVIPGISTDKRKQGKLDKNPGKQNTNKHQTNITKKRQKS